MREDWEYRKLGEVCDINYGTRVVQKNDKGSTYYVYGGGGATFMVDNYNREDCLIVARFAMSAKCTRFVKGKFFLNDSGLSVSPKIKNLSQAFVDKALLANNNIIYSMGKGMAQKNLDMPSFRNLIIPIPPREEQERIVSELDLLSGILEKEKAEVKELERLAESIFYDMFGELLQKQDKIYLKDIADYYIGLTYSPSNVCDEGCIVLRSSNIQNNALDFKDIVRVNSKIKDDKFVRDGDILMCSRNGSAKLVGKVARIRNLNERMSFGAFMTIIRSQYNDFLFHFFLSDFFRKQLACAQTATINQITTKMLDGIKLNVPPLSLQREFAERIERIEEEKGRIRRAIEETGRLFDYTMERYFG